MLSLVNGIVIMKMRRDTHSKYDDDWIFLPICTGDIFGELYDLVTWMDELRFFLPKIFVRKKMVVYCDYRKILVDQWILIISNIGCFKFL